MLLKREVINGFQIMGSYNLAGILGFQKNWGVLRHSVGQTCFRMARNFFKMKFCSSTSFSQLMSLWQWIQAHQTKKQHSSYNQMMLLNREDTHPGGVRRRYINTLGGAEGSAWAPAASWAPQCHSAAAAWPREMAWGIPRVMQPPPGALPSLGPWLTMPCGSLALTPSGLGLGRDSITQQPGSYVLPARNRRGSLWLRLVLGSLAGEVSSCPDLSRVIRHLYPKYTISSQETHE